MNKRNKYILLGTGILLLFIIIWICRPRPQQQAILADPDKLGYRHIIITPKKYKTLTSVNLSRYKGNDTFVITQNTGNWLLNIDSGLSWEQPLVFINATGKMIKAGAVAAENCQYIKILGIGSSDAYGFEFRGGGITMNWQGKINGIVVESVRITGGRDGSLWVKEEAPHACDFYNYWHNKGPVDSFKYGIPEDYLAPNFQDSVWIEHCWIDSSGGDAYFGSTGTIKGRDQIPCRGNQKLPTMQAKNFHINYNYVNYLGRSGIQLSLGVGGTNTIIGNVIENCGYEWAETHGDAAKSQGAGIRIGSGDVNVEVANNRVKYTNIYNYDLGEGNVNFHDNWGDSVGYVVYHGTPYYGGQAIPSLIVHADNPQKSKLTLKNNQMYHTTGGGNIGFAIYGGSNFRFTNDTCNNTGSQFAVLAAPFVAQQCEDGGGGGGTHDSTYAIVHDTTVREPLPPHYERIFDSTVVDTTRVTIVKIHGVPATKTSGRIMNWAIYDSVVVTGDTVITRKTPPHDTTVQVPNF